MAHKQPSDADRIDSHLLIGLVASFLGGKIKGVPGAMVVAIIAVYAHQQFDAPLAQGIANIT